MSKEEFKNKCRPNTIEDNNVDYDNCNIYAMRQKIKDLEAKLAESDAYKLRIELAGADETISQLKQQLAEMTEKYNACQEARKLESGFSQQDKKELIQQLAEKDKEIKRLNRQLKATEKERHEEWKTGKEWKWECDRLRHQLSKKDQDKISFAVEQLNLLYKTLTTEDVWRAMKKGWWLNNGECLQLRQTIDNQIKQLKEGK